MQWSFGPFRLDTASVTLWHGAQRLPVRPKAFDVLVYLVSRAGELVLKETLLEAVWPEAVVGDAVLKVRIRELRQVLGETAQETTYIETVPRRGYRFCAPVTPMPTLAPRVHSAAPTLGGGVDLPPIMVGRETELAQLQQCFARACQGQRQVVCMGWRGWALAMQGEGEAGLAQMREGMATALATGQTLSKPFCLVLLAEAAGHVNQVEEGLYLLTEALAAFETSGRGDMLAEAYRLQGEFLLRQAIPETARAEACFQQALAIARRQQARSWELRAAMSLSQLWQQQGKHTDARHLLTEVYNWFTEGFDTADLQAARALLDALAL